MKSEEFHEKDDALLQKKSVFEKLEA